MVKPSIISTLITAAMLVRAYTPPWTTLPPTPELPHAYHEAHAPINNISLWYGLYGPRIGQAGSPVVVLHGGKISSRWWGRLIKSLECDFSVIAIDTRAHGRSTDDLSVKLSYNQFAADAIALLDHLKIPKASFVGWSDGAVTSLTIAMNYPARADRIIAFGANYRPDQANATGLAGVTFGEDLYNRQKTQYLQLSPDPHPNFERFYQRVVAMQEVEPFWDEKDFAKIPVFGEDKDAPFVLVAAGDYEEAIIRTVPGEIHGMVSCSPVQYILETTDMCRFQTRSLRSFLASVILRECPCCTLRFASC
jgi:pimeloyl-ACP methyl ester carboxylesterase